jgi:hypothetical protein
LSPLSIDSSTISILERLQLAGALWETVWAETITILHGPPGYLGPNRIQGLSKKNWAAPFAKQEKFNTIGG